MLLVNNSGLVYEFKKAVQSSELLVFFLHISGIYSNVTENLPLLFPFIYFYLIHGVASTIRFQNKNLESLNWQVISN